MVKKGALCKNCSKRRHIASKCCSPPMYKKGPKYQHTLLRIHVEVDLKTEETKVSKDVCDLYGMAPSKRGEEVLLITCGVEVMAPDAIVTQARALLDCAELTSLVMERLTKKLCPPWHPSNFTINRVA